MPELMESPEMFDGTMAFEDEQIDQTISQLEEKKKEYGIDDDTIRDVREKLRMTGAVRYDHPAFSITRNLSQGFDIHWKTDHREAA